MNYDTKDEQLVMDWLLDKGYTVVKSTTAENISGIDCYINEIATDIKCQAFNNKHAFCFEVMVYSEQRKEWINSWFVEGKSDHYLFVTTICDEYGNSPVKYMYNVSRPITKEYIKKYGFDYERELSTRVRLSQRSLGHDHTNAQLGFIYTNNLIKFGGARFVGKLL
jgi:hypothetical protein